MIGWELVQARRPLSGLIAQKNTPESSRSFRGDIIYIFYYAILLTALVRREIFLEAVFLWKIPLEAALLISELATFNAASAASLLPSAMARSTFLMQVFTLDLMDLLRNVFVWMTKILFFADLILANLYTSKYIELIFFVFLFPLFRTRTT